PSRHSTQEARRSCAASWSRCGRRITELPVTPPRSTPNISRWSPSALELWGGPGIADRVSIAFPGPVVSSSGFVVKLELRGALGLAPAGSQRSSDERALCPFFARRARGFRRPRMHFNAVRTLGGERHAQGNQLTILPGNCALITADNLVQVQPGV